MKRGWGALVVTLVMVAFITPALTTARFSSRSSELGSAFSVGMFVPPVSPTPIVAIEGSSVRVKWPKVMFPGSSLLSYRVRRSTASGTTSEVCTGSAVPTETSGEVSCLDTSLQTGETYRYAIQPVLIRSGMSTWSLPFGAESGPVGIAGLVFAGVGPIISVTSPGLVSVPYPVGTESGDFLVLVVVNGRNKAPRRPAGWTDVVSRGIGGAQDFHLYVAQRIADNAASVVVDVDTGSEGSSLQVVRYDVPPGVSAPTLRASQVQSGFSTAATVQFVPTPDIITTGPATALSIVAVRASNGLSVVAGSAWTLRLSAVATSGTTPLAWAVADSIVGAASTVPSPTWQQTGNPARWIFGGSAFG